MGILILFLAAAFLASFYSALRLFSLKSGIREVRQQLTEIGEKMEENRILHLPRPDYDLERLLLSMNHLLEKEREERVHTKLREQEFRRQLENISHDLRTPLTSILGYINLLDKESFSAEDRESLSVIERKSRTLQRLIAQFYDLAQLESGDYQLDLEEVDAGRVLRETLLGCYQELAAGGISVRADIPEEAFFIWADADALERVFLNLFQNAVRYAKSSLEIGIRKEENKVLLFWENDAEHLKKEDIKRLFDRFYTGDEARSSGSTGLGLSIAVHLVKAMDGMMEAALREEEIPHLVLSIQFHAVF